MWNTWPWVAPRSGCGWQSWLFHWLSGCPVTVPGRMRQAVAMLAPLALCLAHEDHFPGGWVYLLPNSYLVKLLPSAQPRVTIKFHLGLHNRGLIAQHVFDSTRVLCSCHCYINIGSTPVCWPFGDVWATVASNEVEELLAFLTCAN